MLLTIPISVGAVVFNPEEDTHFNLSEYTVFNYDSFNLKEGVKLNYTIPEDSTVSIVSDGDINIYGDIFVSKKAQISLKSIRGSISIFGSIYADFGFVDVIVDRIDTENATFFSSSSAIEHEGFLFNPLPIWGLRQHLESNYYSSGSFSITDSRSGSTLTLVPIPASILLFISALLPLFVRNKKYRG